MKKLSGMCWELWITKINPNTGCLFTENEAKLHVKSFRKSSKYYWLKRGYSESDAILKSSEFQRSNAKKSANIIRHMDDRTITQYKYWMNRGYSEDAAKLKVSEIQNRFSLDICIEKYGYIEGTKRWEDRQYKWQKSLINNDMDDINSKKSVTLLSYIEKYGEDTGKKLHIKLCKNKNRDIYLVKKTYNIIGKEYNKFYDVYSALLAFKNDRKGQASTESLKLFYPLYRKLRRKGVCRNDIMFGVTGSKEYCISRNKQKKFYDFTILSKKIIVEYNHKTWHPNPNIMSKDEWLNWKHPFDNTKTANDKYIYDMMKNKLAELNGFKVITVWSHIDITSQIDMILEYYDKN